MEQRQVPLARPLPRPAAFSSGATRRLATAACAVLAVAGCFRPAPGLAPLPPDAVIVAFGDSLTRGTGAPAGADYPAVLQRMVGRTVVNAGVPGETTSGGLRRLPGVLGEYRPALVVLCEGGNDFLRGVAPGRTEANLRAMVARVRESGAAAVLLGVPRPSVPVRVPGFFRAVAGDLGIPYDGELLGDILTAPSLKSDPVHPNADGYRRLAEGVARLLRSAGALPDG